MMMRRGIALLSLMALLSACERASESAPEKANVASVDATKPTVAPMPSPAAPALKVSPINFTLKDTTGCDDRCASFSVQWLEFPRDPALNRLVLDQVSAPVAATTKAALSRQGQDFLRDAMEAQEPWEQAFTVTLLPGLGDVSVIEVVAYSFTGGAHGMTSISTINYDRAGKKTLQLSDIIVPASDAQFWQIARRAHGEWVAKQDDPQSFEGWPFVPTSTFLLTPDALVLQYDPYAIGPYSMGLPAIPIGYERLREVLQPSYLPER